MDELATIFKIIFFIIMYICFIGATLFGSLEFGELRYDHTIVEWVARIVGAIIWTIMFYFMLFLV